MAGSRAVPPRVVLPWPPDALPPLCVFGIHGIVTMSADAASESSAPASRSWLAAALGADASAGLNSIETSAGASSVWKRTKSSPALGAESWQEALLPAGMLSTEGEARLSSQMVTVCVRALSAS